MKLLAAVFAGIVIFAILPGFAMNVMPILSLCGKVATFVALAGFAITAVAGAAEQASPFGEDENEIHA
jgi:hypothetical protein